MILEHTKGVCPSPGTATSTRSDWRIRTRLPLKQVAASGLPDALEFAMAALLEYCCARDGHTPLPTFNLITPEVCFSRKVNEKHRVGLRNSIQYV